MTLRLEASLKRSAQLVRQEALLCESLQLCNFAVKGRKFRQESQFGPLWCNRMTPRSAMRGKETFTRSPWVLHSPIPCPVRIAIMDKAVVVKTLNRT